MKVTVDAMGKSCPIPVVETKKAIEAMTEDGLVSTHVDNETAVENLKRLAEQAGKLNSVENAGENHYIVNIEVEAGAGKCEACDGTMTIAVFDSAVMGSGSDELGKLLIKGFVYALRELPKLPTTCLFYNGGAYLTTEGSECLEDLKAMEEDGVEILTCGTCAKFFGLDEKLAVGKLTNMYTIVEKMSQADKVIRP